MRSSSSTGRGSGRQAKPIPGEEHLARREGAGAWQIQFSIDGHRVRESSGTADKAAAAALAVARWDQVWRLVKLGEKPAVAGLDLNAVFVRFYSEVAQGTAYGERAQKHQLATILAVLGPRTLLTDLDDALVNDLVQALRKRRVVPHNRPEGHGAAGGEDRLLSPATVNRHLTTLHTVCKRARRVWKMPVGEWELSEHKLAEPKGREVFLDHAQARILIDAAIPHARPILLLALASGLRKENAHGLLWENVSMDMGRGVLITKGDKPFAFDLAAPVLDLLNWLEPDQTKRKGPVFYFGNPRVGCECAACMKGSTLRGKPIRSTKRAFATATKALGPLGGGRLRFHDLRHTFASWMLASSGNLLAVRDALGHSDVATTQRYAHLLAGDKRRIVNEAVEGLTGPVAIEDQRKKA